jgi:hypothetical protein
VLQIAGKISITLEYGRGLGYDFWLHAWDELAIEEIGEGFASLGIDTRWRYRLALG